MHKAMEMDSDILISIIIPVFNREQFLAECLDSVIQQTLKSLEVIIIDDGSTDLSYDIALDYSKRDPRIKLKKIHNTGSPSIPRNIGLEMAQGKYVSFIDSDDKLTHNALELLFKNAESLETDITFSIPMQFNMHGYTCPIFTGALKNPGIAFPIQYRREALFIQFSYGTLFLKDFLTKNNAKFNPAFKHGEDQAFMFTALLTAQKISCIQEHVYLYRKDHDNIALTANLNEEAAKSILEVVNLVEKKIRTLPESLFKNAKELLLELKLFRLEYLDSQLMGKAFFTNFIKNDFFNHTDIETLNNIMADNYEIFAVCGHNPNMKNRYKEIFYKYLENNKNPSQSLISFDEQTIEPYKFNNEKEIIPIVFAANGEYVPYFECALLSLIKNASDKFNYHIIILERHWDTNQKTLISQQYSDQNIAISFRSTTKLLDKINLVVNHYISLDTYSRLLIPFLLPGYQKCIYLDSDLIVDADISELYNNNLGNNLLGAVIDYGMVYYVGHLNYLGIKTSEYFNAGVLLWNIDETRKQNLHYSLLNLSQNTENYIFLDQDIMNIAFYKQTKFLEYKWNYHPDGTYIAKNNINLLNAWNRYKNSNRIIHYVTDQKPWLDRNRKNADVFWSIAIESLHYEIIMQNYINHLVKNVS